jgi:hypothetical protein
MDTSFLMGVFDGALLMGGGHRQFNAHLCGNYGDSEVNNAV